MKTLRILFKPNSPKFKLTPLIPVVNKYSFVSTHRMSSSSSSYSGKTNCCSIFNFTKSDFKISGFHRRKCFKEVICCRYEWQLPKEMEDMMKETFLTWPKAYPNIKDMVSAGFYYTESVDETTSISCGVVLEDCNSTRKKNTKYHHPNVNYFMCN